MKTWWIFQKDLREGIRNVQLLLALLLPIGLAVLYNVIYPDTTALPKVTVAYAVKGTTTLPRVLRIMTQRQANVQFQRLATAGAVRDRVAREKVDLGLVVPEAFDQHVANGTQPQLRVIVRNGAGA